MWSNRFCVLLRTSMITVILLVIAGGCSDSSDSPTGTPSPPPLPPPVDEPQPQRLPNILFIVLDDLGVDQLATFGYGGVSPVQTPSLDALADAGVRFRNTWSMPTCSPTRATFFQGRYPFRTQVRNAIVSSDLANSQVSPHDLTIPRVLREQGYTSAVVGKMHISGSNLNPATHPFGNEIMRELGWDYFEGYHDGGPFPIDTTAGGVAEEGVHGCGFVPNSRDNPLHGADSGACYLADNSCSALDIDDHHTPGRLCLERGGIFDPGSSCQEQRPSHINFSRQNGYYTAEWIINNEDGTTTIRPASDPGSRGYRTRMETDRAIAWIQRQPSERPWMLSIGYSAIHTPLQQPPEQLLPEGAADTGSYNCAEAEIEQMRTLSDQMLAALDAEIGRLLVEAGLAERGADGTLSYQPEETNTAIVIIGDNGTFGPSVKAPFNPTRAKGFPYQTGVWVPLIVSGPMVVAPGRDVPHMVNAADLFSLFGELAELDVQQMAPPYRQLDAQPLLPYLTEPGRMSIRANNYTELGTNTIASNSEPPPPCVIPAYNLCAQLFPQQGVCEDQGGLWYGPNGVAGAEGLNSCCAVNEFRTARGESAADLMPESQSAMRDEEFKLVRLSRLDCATGEFANEDEFYRISESAPIPLLDNPEHNLLANAALTARQQEAYEALGKAMQALQNSAQTCPGDGNGDGLVNQEDLDNWQRYSELNEGRSSWYDLNLDGRTDREDLAIIEASLGSDCRPASGG